MSKLRQRLEKLTIAQREELQRRLDEQRPAQKNRRLVAYAAADDGGPVTVEELRAFLKERLPEYMVPADIVLLAEFPRTPNGKIDRRALPEPESSNALEAGGSFFEPQTAIEKELARIWEEVLGIELISLRDNFFEIGGDSIMSIQIVSRAKRAGLALKPADLFDYPTIGELSAVIGRAGEAEVDLDQQSLVTGPLPLTPIQHWFFDQPWQRPAQWNQAFLLRATEPLDRTALENGLRLLLQQHDALRSRFWREAGGWRQEQVGLPDRLPLAVHDLRGRPADAQKAAIEAEATRLHQSFDLEEGVLLRAAHFILGDDEKERLLLVSHHLVVDNVSWQIILEDLADYYGRERAAEGELPRKTTSYSRWSRELGVYARSPAVENSRAYWLAAAKAAVGPLPVDHEVELAANTVANIASVTVALPKEQTDDLLFNVPAVYRTQINDLLLTALSRALAGWTGRQDVRLALEGHGRESFADNLDISRTVGWFTSVFPVVLHTHSGDDPGAALLWIKEQLRAIPGRGFNHGLLRYPHPEARDRMPLDDGAEPEVLFNYAGRTDALLSETGLFAVESTAIGQSRFGGDLRRYLLEINCAIEGDQLRANWSYCSKIHDRKTITWLADQFINQLRELIDHCLVPEAGGVSPSDFPLAGLDQGTLDQLAGMLDDLDD